MKTWQRVVLVVLFLHVLVFALVRLIPYTSNIAREIAEATRCEHEACAQIERTRKEDREAWKAAIIEKLIQATNYCWNDPGFVLQSPQGTFDRIRMTDATVTGYVSVGRIDLILSFGGEMPQLVRIPVAFYAAQRAKVKREFLPKKVPCGPDGFTVLQGSN